ncbi:MAG TPA: sulfotransferase [Frankiaceae bacterium]|nr:sulfotransferase [Frankiaceae bacterium]
MTKRNDPRPDWARRLIAMGPNVGGAQHLIPLDPDELIATAKNATGLADFGSPTWEEPFRLLVAALDTEARLHALGRLMSRNDLLRHLSTRLLVVDAAARNPAITEERVSAPVFITGPARSGTSILHELLGEDPALRAPLAWEMAHPFPPPPGTADDRREWAEPEFDLWADVNPAFGAVHELKASLPEECLWLLAPEFDSGFWATNSDIPSFLGWRAGSDPLPAYRMHKLMLQVLQHQSEQPARPWALKSPMHLMRLQALFAVYPDARVILTHRDPVKTVTSSVSTLAAGRWVRSNDVDTEQIAASSGFGLSFMLNALVEQRPQLPAGQVADLHYLDLISDPVAAIESAYASLGLPFDPALPDKIRSYLASRPQHKHGEHRYSAADFGLDPAEIRQSFLPYTDAFNVRYE